MTKPFRHFGPFCLRRVSFVLVVNGRGLSVCAGASVVVVVFVLFHRSRLIQKIVSIVKI